MRKQISQIIGQYLAHRFPPPTEEKVQLWLTALADQEAKEQASLEYWNTLDASPNAATYRALHRVNTRIGMPHAKRQMPLHIPLLRISAVLIPLLFIAGSYFFFPSHDIVKISTAYGEEKHLWLPDSSEVWLNAGTTIEYPEGFDARQRTVTLRGEAYFSVKRNAAKPFIVRTTALSVKVLGTQFNVKAYPDDARIVTTLKSGKVEVQTRDKDTRTLKPNQQLSYQRETARIEIAEILADETTGWMNGRLIFTNATLSEILQTLQRRFDLTLKISPSVASSQERYTVKFVKNDTLAKILNTLKEIVEGLSYQKQGKKLIVTKESVNQAQP